MSKRIGYARSATGSEQQLEQQTARLRVAGCATIFSDKGSGTDPARPGLQDAINALERGDELVICDLKRLARNVGLAVAIHRQIADKGVKIIELDAATAGKDHDTLFLPDAIAFALRRRNSRVPVWLCRIWPWSAVRQFHRSFSNFG